MATHHEQQQPITLENCQIQKAKYSENMEVLIKQSTTILTSPHKLDNVVLVSSSLSANIIPISLDQIEGLPKNQNVTASIKVLKISGTKKRTVQTRRHNI